MHEWLGRLLIVALFLIEIPRYYATLPDESAPIAAGTGVLLSGGAWYIIESWGRLKRRKGSPPRGTNRLLVMTAILVVSVPVIMAPAMVANEHALDTVVILRDLLGYLVELAWMTVITLAPVTTGIFVAYAQALQYSQVSESSSAQIRSKSLTAKSANAEQRISENQRSLTANPTALSANNGRSAANVCEACGAEFATPQGLSGHKRHCSEWAALREQRETEIPEL